MADQEELAFAPGRYAALDIGTVTCRMLVADVDAQGGLHELDREYRITNLGEGVDASGELLPQAMQRVAAAVGDYLRILDGLCSPDDSRPRVTAVATSAARDAKNAAEFEAMLSDLGVSLSVIPGDKEAELGFKGASCDFLGDRLIVADVGGGSTEIVAGTAGEKPEFAHSFNIGCRRVTERFLHGDPPSDEELASARSWMTEGMADYFARLREAGYEGVRLVAVAGTATSVVSIRDRMEVYDSSLVHLSRVSREELDEVYEQMRSVPLSIREKTVGLDPGRAPVVVAGLVILQTVLDLAGADSFTASESDILQGIILDAASAAAKP